MPYSEPAVVNVKIHIIITLQKYSLKMGYEVMLVNPSDADMTQG